MTEPIIPNRSVLATLAMHQLADQLAPPSQSQGAVAVMRRWGTVSAVNAGGTVDVTIGTTTIPGIGYLSWYIPVIGDTVAVDVVGSDIAVVGTTSLATSPQAGAMLAAATNANTGSALVKRDSLGYFAAGGIDLMNAPTSTTHAARKGYVDGLIDTLNGSTASFRIQTGTASVTLSAATSGSVAVALTGFTAAPVVLPTVTNQGSLAVWCGIDSLSTTSVTLWVRANASTTGTVNLSYHAIGR